ncbi:MAG: glycosyltransferase family 2 protein [Kiritimatiellae bacterium]|nr:glycosyltransferase family 2 protein [Kiritimatiellia bacterium]
MPNTSDRPAVSVVVPVYNAARWLPESLSDLLGQTLRDAEFIFVDDGSTDGSMALLEEAAARDGRVRVLRQGRRFAGAARNLGLDAARGKWFIALDADDRFKPRLLEAAVARGEQTGADIVVFDADRLVMPKAAIVPDPGLARCGLLPDAPFRPGEDTFEVFRVAATWNKLHRTDFVRAHGLRYQETYECNDIRFSFLALAHADRVAALPRVLLHYRTGLADNVQSNKEEHPFDVLAAYSSLREMLLAGGLWPEFGRIFTTRAAMSLFGGRMAGFKTLETARLFADRLRNSALAELGLAGAGEADLVGPDVPALAAKLGDFRSLPFEDYLWRDFRAAVASRDSFRYKAYGAKRRLEVAKAAGARGEKVLAKALRKLEAAKSRARSVRQSPAFRLGMALTWPLRAVLSVLRGKKI